VYGIDNNQGLTALPVLDVPMGGRAEGMATAFAAVSDDASFIEWNPAGSSMLARTELAFFHNNWIADTKVEGAVYAIRFGNLGLAAGGKWLYLPFTEYNQYGDRASKGQYSEAVAVLNGSYNFLSGYYFYGLSLGASLKGAFRFVPDYSDDRGSIISGSGARQSSFSPLLDLGLLTRFNFLKLYYARERNSSVALVFRNIGLPVMGDPLPTAITAAVSYKPFRPFTFSFDFSIPVNLLDPSLSEKPYAAIGFSGAVTPFLALKAGLLSKTGNVRVTIGSSVIMDDLSLDINYSLDLLTQLQPLNRVSISAKFDFGDRGRGDRAAKVEKLYIEGLELYAQGEPDDALRLWEEALSLDPLYDPAREGRAAIQGARKLEERIDEIQRIE
jgi:tetratricopeptide (TPR) repeat protein